MPSFFQFTQGTESRVRPNESSSPLLGRFRAVPPQPGLGRRRSSQLGLLSDRLAAAAESRGSVHIGYGALVAAGLDREYAVADNESSSSSEDEEEDDLVRWRNTSSGGPWSHRGRKRWKTRWRRYVIDVWVEPKQRAVKRVVDRWYSRYGALILLPAALAVTWCAIPFPQYPLERGRHDALVLDDVPSKTPGHGAARVQVNFWFFLFVYYGFYNVTALIWITKVFNLYSLNWWPQSLGFPLTMVLIAALSIAAPIPIYFIPSTQFLIIHNTSWISWTFIIMAIPVAIAFLILLTNERHIGLRNSISDTQRIFTTSWWTGDLAEDTFPRRDRRRRNLAEDMFTVDTMQDPLDARGQSLATRKRWLPASFVRFLWFCVALFIGLMAYVIGEAYAEIYLRTLPHNNLETVVYVWGWVLSVHLLDALTGWVLGIRQGERVGSYPLSWVFKLYFMLTYQTYVRALYARLRSPSQFVILQLLSSTGLIILTPLTMTRFFHRALTILGLNAQSYDSYQKLQTRNVFIRFFAENTSMACFLGSILVLHFGANQDVYPYFAFDDESAPYDFDLTFWASGVTWACELVAALIVRVLIRLCFGVDVGLEGKLDLAVWPELLPTSVVVMLHVLQNMMFSIIRLQFKGP